MKQLYFLALLLVLLASCEQKKATTHDARQDSIEKYLKLAENINLPQHQRVIYNDKAFEKIQSTENYSTNSKINEKVLTNYFDLGMFSKLIKSSDIIEKKAKKAKDISSIGYSYRCKSIAYQRLNRIDSSYFYCIKAEKIYLNTKEKDVLGNIYLNKGVILYNIGDLVSAEQALLKSYKIYKNSHKPNKIYDIFNQLGLVYNDLNYFQKSFAYHTKCIKILNKSRIDNSEIYYAQTYNNLGYLYIRKQNYTNAIKYLKKGLVDKSIINKDPEAYALLLDNMGLCYLRLNSYQKANELFQKVVGIKNRIENFSVYVNVNVHLSEYWFKKGNIKLAITYSKQSFLIADKIKSDSSILYCMQNLIKVDKINASENAFKYIEFSDSLLTEERRLKDRFARITYETDQIKEEKETAVKQKWFVLITALGVLLSAILVFIIYRQRGKQRELQLEKAQQTANDEIYQLMLAQKDQEEQVRQSEKKRIAKELHDGVMNKLSSTRLNLFALTKKRDDATIDFCIDHIKDIYSIEQEIRNIAHDLHQQKLEQEKGFAALLLDLVQQNQQDTLHFQLIMDQTIDWNAINQTLKMNLYRILQESCANIQKHANATLATISIQKDANTLAISISDNGKGFNPETTKEGMGIDSMKQRVVSLAGKISFHSITGKSTTINISLPFFV